MVALEEHQHTAIFDLDYRPRFWPSAKAFAAAVEDVFLDGRGLEEGVLGDNLALPPRRALDGGSSASDFFTTNKTALIGAAVVVCALLMAFTLWSSLP